MCTIHWPIHKPLSQTLQEFLFATYVLFTRFIHVLCLCYTCATHVLCKNDCLPHMCNLLAAMCYACAIHVLCKNYSVPHPCNLPGAMFTCVLIGAVLPAFFNGVMNILFCFCKMHVSILHIIMLLHIFPFSTQCFLSFEEENDQHRPIGHAYRGRWVRWKFYGTQSLRFSKSFAHQLSILRGQVKMDQNQSTITNVARGEHSEGWASLANIVQTLLL